MCGAIIGSPGGCNIAASGMSTEARRFAAGGVGTSGTSLQYIAGNDGLLVEAFHDNGGGANQEYRVYTDSTHPNPTTANYSAAGTTSIHSLEYTDPYHRRAFSRPKARRLAQVAFSQRQRRAAASPAGIIGFAWHTMTISQDGVNMKWSIDGHLITTVPDSALTCGRSAKIAGHRCFADSPAARVSGTEQPAAQR